MKQFIFTISFLFTVFNPLFSQFSELVNDMAENNRKFPKELIYLHTDREVYSPGDTIWFKAYIREKASLLDKTVSQTFKLKIINAEGNIVSDTKHLVFHSESIGQIGLKNSFEEGFYHLVAYSSWMKNYAPGEVFRKTIRVKKYTKQHPGFTCHLSRAHYFERDTIKARLGFFDADNNIVFERIRLSVIEGDSVILRKDIRPENDNTVRIPLPQRIKEDIRLKLSAIHTGYAYDTIINLPVQYGIHVGFYPEGGDFISGLTNRVAFKAVSSNGLPVNIEGDVYNESDEKLFSISSLHDGMGMFLITPDVNRKLYMKISKPSGISKKFYLPEAEEKGYLLQVSQAGKALQITVVNNYEDPQAAMITISMRGQLLHYMIDTLGHYYTKSLSSANLAVGIAEITLFDSKLKPRAERLVFLNQDRIKNASMVTEYPGYLPRDLTELKIDLNAAGMNMAAGSYSLAVVDNELCMSSLIDDGNILSRFLLSSGLRGRIHKPAYYFNEENEMRSQHLDLLLLTQGWRKYQGGKPGTAGNGSTRSPKVQDVISGTLYTSNLLKKREAVKGRITIFNSGGTGDMATQDNGKFEFIHNYDTLKSPNITLFGRDENGGTQVHIQMDEDRFEKDLAAYYEEFKDSIIRDVISRPEREIQFDDRLTLNINNQWLEEVTIIAKNREEAPSEAAALPTARKATQIELDASLYLNEVIRNMGIPDEWQVFWYMEDFPRPYEDIRYTKLEDIKEIIVLRSPDTQQYLPPEEEYVGITFTERVVALVYLKPIGSDNRQISENNMVMLKRIEEEKEFYKPLYNTEALRHSSVYDLRKTIHWDPGIAINADGRASVKYYNGDRYTTVKCILEGMRNDGIPVYGEYDYRVVLSKD
jgi:hypothetical protein